MADTRETHFPFYSRFFLLFLIAFQVPVLHHRPLCIQSVTTKLLTQKCPYAQLLNTIPRRKTQSDPARLFLLISSALQRATHVPVLQCVAMCDSHSDQLLTTLHPNRTVLASNAHFLWLWQFAQSVPSSRFLARTLFRDIIRCKKTSGFAFEKWFSSTTQSVHNLCP